MGKNNPNRELRVVLPFLNAVTAGKPLLIDMEPLRGLRIKQIIFKLGDTAKVGTGAPAVEDVLGEIRMDYVQEDFRRLLAAELDLIQTANDSQSASTAVAGASGNGKGRRLLTMEFCEPNRGNLTAGDILGLPTSAEVIGATGKLKLEVDIADGITPSVEVIAVCDGVQGVKGLPYVFMEAHDIDTGGDSSTISKILDAEGDALQITLLDPADATIESVNCEVKSPDGTKETIHENIDKVFQAHFLKNVAKMTMAAGSYHLVFDASGTLRSQVPATGLKIKSTFSGAAAEQYRVIVQRLAVP